VRIRNHGAWIVSLALVAQGCAGPPQTYPGPRLTADQVAILESDAKSRILGVDGRGYFDRVLEILPGEHSIRFKYQVEAAEIYSGMLKKPTDRAVFMCDAELVAEAGHTYRIVREKPKVLKYEANSSAFMTYVDTFRVEIVDLTANQTVLKMNASVDPGPGMCPWERDYRRK